MFLSTTSTLLLMVFSLCALAGPPEYENIKSKEIELSSKKRVKKDYYTYIERRHSHKESAKHIAGIFGVSVLIYPLTQPDTFRESGSFRKYRDNFGKITFDQDAPFWNWFIHPISGSQLFLYYRANGYSRTSALTMSFISSALFEFTVEIYQERASVQDLFQTPVIGSILGLGIENLSMYLLNSGNTLGKILGHAINPSTLFWFYEGKVKIIPEYNGKDTGKLSLIMDF